MACFIAHGAGGLERQPQLERRAFVFSVFHQQQITTMRPGDVLLLYTDGVTEARDDVGDQFGEDRLMRLLADAGCSDAEGAVAAVAAAVEAQVAGSCHEADDMALLALTVPA